MCILGGPFVELCALSCLAAQWFIYILAFLQLKIIKRVTCSHVSTNIRTHRHAHTLELRRKTNCAEWDFLSRRQWELLLPRFCRGLPSMETSCRPEELANWPASGDKHGLCYFSIRLNAPSSTHTHTQHKHTKTSPPTETSWLMLNRSRQKLSKPLA